MSMEKHVYPAGSRGWVLYVVGDIHGRLDLLRTAHARIAADKARRDASMRYAEIYLGDLIDRGPNSAGVIADLIVRAEECPLVLLKANHEILLERFLGHQTTLAEWKQLGGVETLMSYGISPRALRQGGHLLLEEASTRIPSAHRQFLARAKPFVQIGDYCFVHAGIRPQAPLAEQIIEDLAWIREDFLDWDEPFGFIVVHGHTPVRTPDFRSNRINLDTGAYMTGNLSVLVIDEYGASLLENSGN